MGPSCLACGVADAEVWAEASDGEYHSVPESFTYYRCRHCGAWFIDPVPRSRLSEIYPPNYYSFGDEVSASVVFRAKDWFDRRFFARFIRRLRQPRLDVLDVGGGSGAQLSSVARVDARIASTTIVDLDDKAGEAAQRRGHAYFHGRFEDFQSERAFDIILLLNLVEHVDDPTTLLRKAGGHLTADGIILVKTPNTDSLDARLFRHRNWGGYHCPRHWVLFDRPAFASMVARAGLRIAHFEYTQGAPFWTTSVLFALERRGWIRTSPAHPVPHHWLYPLLNVAFAGVDLLRKPFARTSQMFVVLQRS